MSLLFDTPSVIDVETGAAKPISLLVDTAKRLHAEWRSLSIGSSLPIFVSPRRGIDGIIDLLAAYAHDGASAIVSDSQLVQTATVSPDGHHLDRPTQSIVVRNGQAAPGTKAFLPQWTQKDAQGRRMFASSGGSTGIPQLGEVPVGNLWPIPAAYQMTGMEPGSRVYIGGPLSHSAFVWAFFTAVEANCTIVITRRFRPSAMAVALDRFHVSWALLPPPEFQAMSSIIRCNRWKPRSLQAVVSTGGRTSAASRLEWYQALSPAQVFDMFATTEGAGVLLANGEEQLERPGTSGRAVWAKAEVRHPRSHAECARGDVGELFLQSLTRARAGSSQFISAGDLAHIDEAGYVYLSGRTDDEVVIEGQNINLEEIARLITQFIPESDVIVSEVHQTNGANGQLGVAITCTHSQVARVRREAARPIVNTFGALALPRRWMAVEALPLTENGKVDRKRVAQWLEDSANGSVRREELA